MRRISLFIPIAVLIAALSACSGDIHSAATPTLLNLSKGAARPAMRTEIPDAAGEKIYISNSAANDIVTYTASGKASKPTIVKGINDPGVIAVDAKGNIYVPNFEADTVTKYTSSGKLTKPTITVGLNEPTGVAVDANGKIYVSNAFTSNVTTYKPNGQQTTPTISNIDGARGIAVDKSGKIYIANYVTGIVTTYTADGKRTKLTIKGLSGPGGIAVDKSGKIYVTNYARQLAYDVHRQWETNHADDHLRIRDALRRSGRRGREDLCDKS